MSTNNPSAIAALMESAKSIYDLHAGRAGAAAQFLAARTNGANSATMADYFALLAGLPRPTGRIRIQPGEALRETFGKEAGDALVYEINTHPRVSHPSIAALFIAKKPEVLALLNAETGGAARLLGTFPIERQTQIAAPNITIDPAGAALLEKYKWMTGAEGLAFYQENRLAIDAARAGVPMDSGKFQTLKGADRACAAMAQQFRQIQK